MGSCTVQGRALRDAPSSQGSHHLILQQPVDLHRAIREMAKGTSLPPRVSPHLQTRRHPASQIREALLCSQNKGAPHLPHMLARVSVSAEGLSLSLGEGRPSPHSWWSQ